MWSRSEATHIGSLAQELVETEGLPPLEAVRRAADLLPVLISYADQWEAGACDAGNSAAESDEC